MTIIFRDAIGYKAVEIDMEYGISFLEGSAYFTDASGTDYKVPMENLNEIQK